MTFNPVLVNKICPEKGSGDIGSGFQAVWHNAAIGTD